MTTRKLRSKQGRDWLNILLGFLPQGPPSKDTQDRPGDSTARIASSVLCNTPLNRTAFKSRRMLRMRQRPHFRCL